MRLAKKYLDAAMRSTAPLFACVRLRARVRVRGKRGHLFLVFRQQLDATVAAAWLVYQGGRKEREWSTGPAIPPRQTVPMVEISKPDFQIWARHNWREGAVEYADKRKSDLR